MLLLRLWVWYEEPVIQDYFQICTTTLSCFISGMITSVVALAGPIGMVASSILSLVSGFLGLFSGSQPESQESMIKRVVEAAINDFRHKDMKEKLEGAKEVFRTVSTSVQDYREKKSISESQANELYNHAFRNVEIFGKLFSACGLPQGLCSR